MRDVLLLISATAAINVSLAAIILFIGWIRTNDRGQMIDDNALDAMFFAEYKALCIKYRRCISYDGWTAISFEVTRLDDTYLSYVADAMKDMPEILL